MENALVKTGGLELTVYVANESELTQACGDLVTVAGALEAGEDVSVARVMSSLVAHAGIVGNPSLLDMRVKIAATFLGQPPEWADVISDPIALANKLTLLALESQDFGKTLLQMGHLNPAGSDVFVGIH